jgi:hypothetical protein
MADGRIVPRRWQFRLVVLLILPAAVALLLLALDAITAPKAYWMLGVCEVDAVDAATGLPIRARVTMTYEGPLAGHKGSGNSYVTLGEPYETYRGMTPWIGYGGLGRVVRHVPKSRIIRPRDVTIVEGIRFKVEADGYEPFAFVPLDAVGRPIAAEGWSPPVFRAELRPLGSTGVKPSWRARPELKHYEWTSEGG